MAHGRLTIGNSTTGGRRNISNARGTQLQNFQFRPFIEKLFVTSQQPSDKVAQGGHRIIYLQAESARPRFDRGARSNNTQGPSQKRQFNVTALPIHAPKDGAGASRLG
jgi:hypothetical protein